MMMGRIVAIGLALAVLAGCNSREDRVLFNGLYFPAKAAPVDKKETLAVFVIGVKGVSQSFDGARAAAAFEGTRYCIKNFGTSKIEWNEGPETAPEALRIENDTLIYSGECKPK